MVTWETHSLDAQFLQRTFHRYRRKFLIPAIHLLVVPMLNVTNNKELVPASAYLNTLEILTLAADLSVSCLKNVLPTKLA